MNNVRLTVAAVRHDGHEAIVTLRHDVTPDPATGIPKPVHSCVAMTCDDCHADLLDLADRAGKYTFPGDAEVEVLRMRLAPVRRMDPAVEAKQRREENKAWAGLDSTGRRLSFGDRKQAHGDVKRSRSRRRRRRPVVAA